jgi:hypothetical protein
MWYGGHWHTMAIAVAAVALVLAAGTVVILSATSSHPAPATLALTIEFNPATWYLTFTPSSFQAPANTVIQFTITNYDPTTRDVPAGLCNVSGTVGASMLELLPGSASGAQFAVFGLSPSDVSHTFTMLTDGYSLNIPIPPAAASDEPSVVVFSFETVGPGVATWSMEASTSGPHSGSGMLSGFFDTD